MLSVHIMNEFLNYKKISVKTTCINLQEKSKRYIFQTIHPGWIAFKIKSTHTFS